MNQLSISCPANSPLDLPLVEPIFARHETFHPRFGWLKKGFDLIKEDPNIFLREDAPVSLGVGKNMVRSIRYWCEAFKVMSKNAPSEFGVQLFADGAWDSFLEDPASLWLLHWNLLKPTCRAAAWYFTFFEFKNVDFTTEELIKELNEWQQTFKKQVVESSLKKDISCILRMYSSNETSTNFLEDSIDSPFQQLGLIQNLGTRGYSFKTGAKANLPASIVVVACLEYASWVNETAKTIAISRLVYDSGSPGMAFKLSENVLCEAIEKVVRTHDNLELSDTAGLIQLSYDGDPKQLADNLLQKYYQRRV